MQSKDELSLRFDENHRNTEYFHHTELQKRRENPSFVEHFKSEEIQKQTVKATAAPKSKASEATIKALLSNGLGYTSLAATVVATVIVATNVLPNAKTPSVAPVLPEVEIVEPLTPIFTMKETSVGLDFFSGSLLLENGEYQTFDVLLKNDEGEIYLQTPLNKDGSFVFEKLEIETSYTLCVQDEEGEEHFSYAFTTESFFTLTPSEDGKGAYITPHSSIPLMNDFSFRLYDGEGKSFSDNVSVQIFSGDVGDGTWDSATDSSTSISAEDIEIYLDYSGLYVGEYVLRCITYAQEAEVVYDKKLQLGDLIPLEYTLEVDVANGEASLQYNSGDIDPYQLLYVELYQGEEYITYMDLTDVGDMVWTMALPSDLVSGNYTAYLVGTNNQATYNQIWKTEITI